MCTKKERATSSGNAKGGAAFKERIFVRSPMMSEHQLAWANSAKFANLNSHLIKVNGIYFAET